MFSTKSTVFFMFFDFFSVGFFPLDVLYFCINLETIFCAYCTYFGLALFFDFKVLPYLGVR
jgi:hypothetical protein